MTSKPTRRRVLYSAGTLAMVTLAGCSGSGDGSSGGDGDSDGGDGGSDGNESGDNGSSSDGNSSSNSSGDGGSEESQDVTQRGAGEDVLENAGLVIQEHEYAEDDYSGYVEGIVENTTDETKSYVQVQVRGYDADGNQLDSYLDNTTDLQAGGTWAFEVPILDYEEMEEYDIAVTDSAL